jgi:putative flippase GtrA
LREPESPRRWVSAPAPDGPRRLVRFVLVGAAGACAFFAELAILVELLHVDVLYASSVAFGLVVLQNYVLHYRWTFRSRCRHAYAFLRFAVMTLSGFVINAGIMYAGERTLPQIHYLFVQAVAIAVVVTWNYLLSARWVFSGRDDGAEPS